LGELVSRSLRVLMVGMLTVVVLTAIGAASGRAARTGSSSVRAAAITAGLDHTCALTRAGAVKCWGYNGHDELGNGLDGNSSLPVDVSGLRSGITAITAGVRHSCALTSAGGVKCWGANYSGALGDGTDSRHGVPVDVSGLSSGVAAISAGYDHSCALTDAGGVKCWGYNLRGALGDGTTTDHFTPVDVSGLSSGVTAIDIDVVGCALTNAGGVKCWGGNYGLTPVDVPGLASDVTAIAVGSPSCAVTSAGSVKCWGGNYGPTPVEVAGLSQGVTAIAAGAGHTCALITGGGVKCWGDNRSGDLGDGTTSDRSTPVDVSGLGRGVIAVAAAGFHSCALTNTGGVKCWGLNGTGQLGDGTALNRSTPVGVLGIGTGKATLTVATESVPVTRARFAPVKLRCGGDAGCQGTVALSASVRGKLVGTSKRRVGLHLGSSDFSIPAGPTQTVTIPIAARGFKLLVRLKRLSTQVRFRYKQPTGGTTRATRAITLTAPKPKPKPSPPVPATAISAGLAHSCALTRAGGVKCWGYNFDSQLGDGTTSNRSTPVDVSGLSSGVSAIATGGVHSCALTRNGGVKCWGGNLIGELGDGTTSRRPTSVDVSGLTGGVTAIAAGGIHSCALTTAGAVTCWGGNSAGNEDLTPVDVPGLSSGITAIAAGSFHSCALTNTGGVKCWGYNTAGQLGDGTTTNSPTPVEVSGLSGGVSAIAAGDSHSCALTSTGGVKCWGVNFAGQLGDGGGAFESSTPVDVSGLSSGVTAVAGGGQHSCALTRNGGVKCWGDNSAGQLGNGRTGAPSTPVAVIGFGR
jgi:alpha-tubulin suppressor-like RCC1 family protein